MSEKQNSNELDQSSMADVIDQDDDKPIIIESMDAFRAILAEPLVCELEINGKKLSIPCERLTAAQQAEIDLIWDPRSIDWRTASNEVNPKPLRDKDGKVYYDANDPVYQRELEQKRTEAKALTVFYGTPLLRNQMPGQGGRNKIVEFVMGSLSQAVVDYLYTTIIREGVGGVLERANFTTTSTLQDS